MLEASWAKKRVLARPRWEAEAWWEKSWACWACQPLGKPERRPVGLRVCAAEGQCELGLRMGWARGRSGPPWWLGPGGGKRKVG